jgi:hypothetical protein
MQKYILILSIVLITTSCQKSEEPTVLEDTITKVNDYADTLTGSVHDARSVVDELNTRNKKVQGQIDAGVR